MSERMFFCYEKDFSLRWTPCVYYGDKPGKRMEYNIERSSIYEVPEDCMNGDEPSFHKLQQRFPPPKVIEND
jgi:hypothetical protein